MKLKLKNIDEQVVVITGASSGIGLSTAQLAARRGAKVVLVSRDQVDLDRAASDIRAGGGEAAITVVADVADEEAMQRAAEAALREFGRIDTWVNNAGVSIYGRIEEVRIADARRLFETNYWGVVNGTLAALPHLRHRGGALINVGSVLSDTGYALQGHYAASKHAVKGFTDSLRIELEHDRIPVSVTLIQPAAIDTPYPQHAENYLGVEPVHMPPVYHPEVVAEAIVNCATAPHRDVLVGGGAKVFQAIEHVAPGLGDRFKASAGVEAQYGDEPQENTSTLHAPRPNDGQVRGRYPGHVMRSSLYTRSVMHPGQTIAAIAALGAVGVLASRAGMFGRRDRRREEGWYDQRSDERFAGQPYGEDPAGSIAHAGDPHQPV